MAYLPDNNLQQTPISKEEFNEKEYLKMNPDVAAAIKAGGFKSGLDHYIKHGKQEGRLGRKPPPFEKEHFAEIPVDISKFQSFRNENFPYAGPYPWLDHDDAEEQIQSKLKSGSLSEQEADMCRKWVRDGYVILTGVVDGETLDSVWAAYEKAITGGVVELPGEKVAENDPYPGRFLDGHIKIPEICRIMRHPDVLKWIAIFTEREPAPFQTIMAHKGSQQGEHSDSIHMTTYPLGYLTAAWVAFEDIHPDSGPLVYYPGSHKLPYIFSKDVGITVDDFKAKGYSAYHERYEPKIKDVIETNKLEPHYFYAKKGDCLIWHANLIHGGSARKNPELSRKSIVSHYFVKGSFCYHDLASVKSRPYAGTCLLRDQKNP